MKKLRNSAGSAIIILAALFLAGVAVYGARSFAFSHMSLREQAMIAGPAFAALALLLCLRLSPPARANLATALVSCAICVYALETGIAILNRAGDSAKSIDELSKYLNGKSIDKRSALELLSDLRKEGKDAWPMAGVNYNTTVSIDDKQVAVLAGISKVTTVHCNENGTWRVYEADEHGFSNPLGLWDRQADVVFLGDSFTHGACVQVGESLPDLVREKYPQTVNLGIKGSGPLQEKAIYVEYARQLRPKRLVWVYFENDLIDFRTEMANPLLALYLSDDTARGLIHRQADVDDASKAMIDRLAAEYESRIKSILLLRSLRQLAGLSVQGSQISRLNQLTGSAAETATERESQQIADVIASVKKDVEKNGGEFYFVFLPQISRFCGQDPALDGPCADKAMMARRAVLQHSDAVLSELRKRKIDIINLEDEFRKNSQLSVYWATPISHYSSEGYRLVADVMLRHLH